MKSLLNFVKFFIPHFTTRIGLVKRMDSKTMRIYAILTKDNFNSDGFDAVAQVSTFTWFGFHYVYAVRKVIPTHEFDAIVIELMLAEMGESLKKTSPEDILKMTEKEKE